MDSVASRYAIALLSIAREENKIKEFVDEVEQISNVLKENKEIIILLKDYGLSLDEKKKILTDCFEDKVNEYILNLLYVLIDNKRGGYIIPTLEEFIRIGLNALNIKRGIVYSTILLSKDQLTRMEQKVSKIINANVTLQNKIDESLLGGFKIQVEDYILDDSMINNLSKLKENITLGKGGND